MPVSGVERMEGGKGLVFHVVEVRGAAQCVPHGVQRAGHGARAPPPAHPKFGGVVLCLFPPGMRRPRSGL